nr:TonB-dependent receptor [Govania unica]
MPFHAFAQSATGGDKLVLEEIIVTSQRREQSLQEVPISVSAFSAETLEKSNVTEAKNYLQFAPNVAFTEDGQTGSRSISISIRGVSNVNLAEGTTTSSIGYYIDDLSVGSVSGGTINPELQDIERIEVLRGPQGTYFGRNALGGALNISTKKPDNKLYAEANASYASFNTWTIGAVVNLPVSEKFFLRGVAEHRETDGFVKNVNPKGTPDSGSKDNTFRLAARALPTDNLTVDLSASYTKSRGGMDNTVPSGVLSLDTQSIVGDIAPIGQGLGFFPQNQSRVNHDAIEYNNNNLMILNGRITYAADGFDIKSITGYIRSRTERRFDQDNIGVDAIIRHNNWKANSFSQELRLQSNTENAFKWTFGGIFARDKFDMYNNIFAGAQGSYTNPVTGQVTGILPPIPAGFRINENNYYQTVRSMGVFAEGTYNITDKLSVILGGRYTEDKIENSTVGVVAFESPVPDAAGTGKFHNFSPRAVIRYEVTPDLNTYISASRGYKTGGVNINNGIVKPFRPETLWNYEAGFKTSLADGRVRFNGSVFYSDWKDLQVQTNYLAVPGDISSAVMATLNAAKATNKGFEVDIQALVVEGLQVGFGAGYLQSKFGSFPDAVLAGNNVVDLTGRRLPKTPKWSLNGVVDYSKSLSDTLEGFVRAEWVYRSSISGNLEAAAAPILGLPSFPYIAPAYNVVNLRAGVTMDAVSLTGYVENLFKETYFNGTADQFGLAGIRLQPHPRIWGLKATYKFGS